MKVKGKIINDEDKEWIADFDFDTDSGFSIPTDLNFETLTDLVFELQENEDINDQLKRLVRTIPITFNRVPIIIYTEVGSINMVPIYEYYVDNNEDVLDEVKKLFNDEDEELASEFLNNSTYSVESLLDNQEFDYGT